MLRELVAEEARSYVPAMSEMFWGSEYVMKSMSLLGGPELLARFRVRDSPHALSVVLTSISCTSSDA